MYIYIYNIFHYGGVRAIHTRDYLLVDRKVCNGNFNNLLALDNLSFITKLYQSTVRSTHDMHVKKNREKT